MRRIASLPISLNVTLDHLSGKVLFICPPGADPLCTMSFYNEPLSKFTVVPVIGGKTKIQNIPGTTLTILSLLNHNPNS